MAKGNGTTRNGGPSNPSGLATAPTPEEIAAREYNEAIGGFASMTPIRGSFERDARRIFISA